MRRLRKILLGALLVCLAVLLAGAAAKAWLDAHFYDGYDPALPLNPTVVAQGEREAYRRVEVRFQSQPDVRVPTVLALPHEPEGPVPCVVFLHGIGQEKDFLDEIAAPFVQAGFAMVSFDQYTRGERKLDDPGKLDEVGAFRRRAALTVIETRRLIDYLETRDDIAGDRLYLVGASYGAITGSTAAAFDPRLRAVVLVYGGGNLRRLLASRASREELGRWNGAVAFLAAWLLAPADPIRHVAEIAPRPILFQNGEEDSLVPKPAAEALFAAAQDPKSITWYEGDHIGFDPATVEKVLAEALDWLVQQDKRITETEE